MPRWAMIRRVMLAAPSDTATLVDIARDSIYAWNSGRRDQLLEPAYWRLDVYPNFNKAGAQAEIDEQILDNSDILIGIFKHRLGTPTQGAPSGTAHEILKHVERGGTAMVYFSKEAVPQDADRKEYDRLQEFKAQCQEKGVIGEFEDPRLFGDLLKSNLTQLYSRYELTSAIKLSALQEYFETKAKGLAQYDKPEFRFGDDLFFDGTAELWCVTYRPTLADDANPFNWWEELKPFQVKAQSLYKSHIFEEMGRNYIHAFKFYLRVPNTREELQQYRNALATADVIVTGKGSPDPVDPKWWRIWFFHPEGFVHPYSARSYLANHSLVDLSWF